MDKLVSETFGLLALIVGVATLAVIVSNSANTSGVISAGAKGFTDILKAAVSPVTQGSGGLRPLSTQ